MKILQVSDLHGVIEIAFAISEKASRLGVDLIVIAGDITHFGGIMEAEDILKRIASSGSQVLFVSGNCDSRELLAWRPKGFKAHNLNGVAIEFSGYFFAGVSGGSGKFGTLTELSEDEFEEVVSKFKEIRDQLILVSHSPPYGTEADFTGSRHIGSTAIKKFIEERQPLLVCCGHAHEGRSIFKIGKTWVVNAGVAKNGFCALIELKGSSVKPELSKLY